MLLKSKCLGNNLGSLNLNESFSVLVPPNIASGTKMML